MPVGVILLLLIAILAYFGLLQRVLDRMHMTDNMAIIFIGSMIIGVLPNIPLRAIICKYRRRYNTNTYSGLSYSDR